MVSGATSRCDPADEERMVRAAFASASQAKDHFTLGAIRDELEDILRWLLQNAL